MNSTIACRPSNGMKLLHAIRSAFHLLVLPGSQLLLVNLVVVTTSCVNPGSALTPPIRTLSDHDLAPIVGYYRRCLTMFALPFQRW
jgi:hypothetical protein